MSRVCDLTGKRPNVANKVSHSNIKTKTRQFPNLKMRKVWWEGGNRYVDLKLSTRAIRTLSKMSLDEFAHKNGIDLSRF